MTAPGTPTGDDRDMRAFAIEAARLMADRHCEDVRLLDVRGLSQVCDYVLIASGTSDRQMKSVVNELEDLGRDRGQPLFRADSDAAVTWVVVDFIELVAHLFEPGQRAYYDLEGLWSDAPIVPWERTGAGAAAERERDLS
jgi:ribosome-associated protein